MILFKKWSFFNYAFLLSILAFLSFAGIAFAQIKPCEPCYVCPTYWTCDGACGATLTAFEVDSCCGKPDRPCNASTGEPQQMCDAGTGAHYCNNSCLPLPENLPKNPRWYDDPTKNNDALADKGNKNDTLPIVLDWELNSWKNSGKYNPNGTPRAMARENYGANSFYIEIDNPNNELFEPEKVPNSTYDSTKKVFGKCLGNDFFNSRDDGAACFFRAGKKDITYRVKACCAADCTNCGPFVTWSFSTGDFTEPKSPLDPDWNGPRAATNAAFKGLQLEWCKAWVTKKIPNEWAKSFQLMTTSDENGAQTCHPLLISSGQCRATDITADTSDDQVRLFYPVDGRNDLNFFTRNRTYVWKMKMCFDHSSAQCGDYGQAWSFTTKNDLIGVPSVVSPENDAEGTTLVGLPVSISWTVPDGTNSFVFESSFTNGEQNVKTNFIPNGESTAALKNKFDAGNLKVDTLYKWQVKACSKFNSQDCDNWSNWSYFRTTGRPPKAGSMVHTDTIPKTFSWEAVSGAKSYNFSLYLTETTVETATSTISDAALLASPKVIVNYPGVDQGKKYAWKVQTCAHADGNVCGAWSDAKSFEVPSLTEPEDGDPGDGDTIYDEGTPRNISWYAVPGASAYHYILTLITPTETNCTQNAIEKTVSNPIDLVELNCLGTYQLSVRPCIDSECQSMGPQSEWKFVLAQQIPSSRPMLSVCGTTYDVPSSPWNEREDCQPKHILLFGKVALDFVLFKVSIFLLPIMVLITGLLFYSSFKTPDIWEKVRNAWKAIGIGFGLLLLAWIIVGFILQIIGFPGIWWKIL